MRKEYYNAELLGETKEEQKEAIIEILNDNPKIQMLLSMLMLQGNESQIETEEIVKPHDKRTLS